MDVRRGSATAACILLIFQHLTGLTFAAGQLPEDGPVAPGPVALLSAGGAQESQVLGREEGAGRVAGRGVGTGTSYLQAPAEAIPQPDASFDVVCSLPARLPQLDCREALVS